MADDSVRRLTPEQVATDLFTVLFDRDQRASAVCAETLLTLVANDYKAPELGDIVSPKRQRFAIRSLALGENFLRQRDTGRAADSEMTPQRYGDTLASGGAIRGSANLALAQKAFEGLLDPTTQRGQRGTWLLFPFHESLLWYDARPTGAAGPWGVRKVYMRGSGITLARMLADPADPSLAELGSNAVEAIREALQAPSPLADIAEQLEDALGDEFHEPPRTVDDEKDAWREGASEKLRVLTAAICRHAEGIMRQGTASGPAKLWQLRTIIGLDLACHALRTAWETTDTPERDRYLLLSFGDAPRPVNRVRQRSEDTYQLARIRISEATVRTLARKMQRLAQEGCYDWRSQFEQRRVERFDDVIAELRHLTPDETFDEYVRLARTAAEQATYGRAGEGFRVLLESIGMLAGTGAYRYLTAPPDILSAFVGALSARMPMSSDEFFRAVFEEWRIVIAQEVAVATSAADQLDGASLERNGRRAEQLMNEAGLALSLSDRTTIVGERARRYV
jgi:hypothetical protein